MTDKSSDPEVFWVVHVMSQTIGIESPWGVADVPLSFAPGMVGAMPIFQTREDAEAFANGYYAVLAVAITPRVCH